MIELGVKVTIGVCVKDSEKTIEMALRSVFAQDFPHELIEIVIVDDGSTDQTLSLVKILASSADIKTRIYHHSWKGIAFSRQVVVDNARSKYLIWVDSDYELRTDFVRQHVGFMESNPDVGVASGQEVTGGETLVAFLESVSALPDNPKQINIVDVGGAIYRVEAIKDAGGFDEELKGAGEDVDLTNRMKKTQWRLSEDQAQFYHRHRKTWKALWSEYRWWGYGMHYVTHKHHGQFAMVNIPLIAMAIAVKRMPKLYKGDRGKRIFLLPLHSFLKHAAWCFGFMESHVSGHGHEKVWLTKNRQK